MTTELLPQAFKASGRFLSEPEQADVMLVIPLDDGRQGPCVLQCKLTDVGKTLLQESLLDAVSVGENWRPLLPQIHVQAAVPAQYCAEP